MESWFIYNINFVLREIEIEFSLVSVQILK